MAKRVTRRAMIAAALAAWIVTPAWASDTSSAATFLRDLYQREIERHNRRLPSDNNGFYAMFTRPMRELMIAPRVANANLPAGPILHALFGQGALPGREVVLGDVTLVREDASSAAVRVTLTVLGNPRQLTVALLRENGVWRIDDIDYAPGDTLVTYYKRITGR
jgi:hypothetical protein